MDRRRTAGHGPSDGGHYLQKDGRRLALAQRRRRVTPTTIYVLSHIYKTRAGEYEEKLLGSYSSRATAQQAIKRYKKLPGFRQHPESFVIFQSVLDQDAAWIEGFFTLNPHAALIFKIVPRAEWEAESGDYHGSAHDKRDGF